jgi:hypothetical protein
MLETLVLQNYRCYEHHTVDFRNLTVVVGKNNAGKSTIIEALRLVQIVISRYRALAYNQAPAWTGLGKSERGCSPSLQGYDFVPENLFHKYGEEPSIISAMFAGKSKIVIYIGNNFSIHSLLKNNKGESIDSKAKAANFLFDNLNILPQVSPRLRNEKILNIDYVKRFLSSNLASLHFRNQIAVFGHYYERFKILAERNWTGLRVRNLEGNSGVPGSELGLMIQDDGFVAEVAWMGHGLQMWLQTMWFLARTESSSTIILDEPDVYMHPDLQRRLIRMLKGQYNQVIIATHSVEIMSEVEPDNILVIDRSKPRSVYASNFPAVQRVIDSIGSVHNLQLAKLWSSKKILIVEGKDVKILKRVHNKIFSNSEEPFDTIPRMEIGGWGGWSYAIGSKMLLKNAGDENITAYCIFDSDYHLPEEIAARYSEAVEKGVQIHIWSKKEIENYFIIPSAIYRIILNSATKSDLVTLEAVKDKVKEIVEGYWDVVMDNYSSSYLKFNRGKDLVTANKYSRDLLRQIKMDGKMQDRVSGKEVIASLSNWSKLTYGVSLTMHQLVQEIEVHEYDLEFIRVIEKIERCQLFNVAT